MTEIVPLPAPFDAPFSEWSTDDLRKWRGRLLFAVNNTRMASALKAEMAHHFNEMARELKRRGLVKSGFTTVDVGL